MKTFKRKISIFFTALAMAVIILGSSSAYAVDGTPPGLFELDGDALDSNFATLPDDWEALYDGGALTGAHSKKFTFVADGSGTSIFTGGSTKDTIDTDQWLWKDGSVPPKDDILNAFAAAYTIQEGEQTTQHPLGNLIIYFGFDRYTNNGDAFGGFWFFQNPVAPKPDGTFSHPHVAKTCTAEGLPHTPGDVLVLMEYPQASNAIPIVKVYEWDPTDCDGDGNLDEKGLSIGNLDMILTPTQAKCDGSGDKDACAITNDVNTDTVWPYAGKAGSDHYAPETFFSGGIDVTNLLGGATPCFSSYLAETRASRSEDSTLKDFALGSFDLCSIKVTKTPDKTQICNTGTSTVDYTYVITNDGQAAVKIAAIDDNATPEDDTDDYDVVTLGDDIVLEPGESHTVTINKPISGTGTITNTVTASAYDVTTEVLQKTATATADVTTATCSIDVTKTPDLTEVCSLNADVDYTIVVTNTGTAGLTNIDVVDDKLGSIDTGLTLAVGASKTYTLPKTLVPDGPLPDLHTNTVTATGDALGITDVATDTASANVTIHDCSISVDKNCTDANGEDQPINFSGTITNTGTTPLTITSLQDVNETGSQALTPTSTVLVVGGTANYSGSYVPNQVSGNHTDTVTVLANAFNGVTDAETEVSDNDDAVCHILTNPQITVTKQCTDNLNVGGDIPFSGKVSNIGDVTLTGLTITDKITNAAGGLVTVPVAVADTELSIDEEVTYNDSYTPFFTWNKNVVEASATDKINGGAPVTATAFAICQACPFVDNPTSTGDTPTVSGTFTY